MNKPGLMISLEGMDGAGKSSHLQWLEQTVRSYGIEVKMTREPGGTPLGERLREILLNEPMDVRTEALLMQAARIEHINQVITPALSAGTWVICDRFTDSSFAYQGRARGLGDDTLSWLENYSCAGLKPDLTLYFDLDPEIARARMERGRDKLDRFETEDQQFFDLVRSGYSARFNSDPERFLFIDSTESIEEIREQIAERLNYEFFFWDRHKDRLVL